MTLQLAQDHPTHNPEFFEQARAEYRLICAAAARPVSLADLADLLDIGRQAVGKLVRPMLKDRTLGATADGRYFAL